MLSKASSSGLWKRLWFPLLPLANFSKQFLVFDLPFIVKDRATAYAALDGELGDMMAKSLEDKGIKTLAFWENGFRMLTNSRRPIERPEDVAGLKIRLMENPRAYGYVQGPWSCSGAHALWRAFHRPSAKDCGRAGRIRWSSSRHPSSTRSRSIWP